MVASGGVQYGHGVSVVCLGDGQTGAEGVPSQGGRGDTLLRRMTPYLTWDIDPFSMDQMYRTTESEAILRLERIRLTRSSPYGPLTY